MKSRCRVGLVPGGGLAVFTVITAGTVNIPATASAQALHPQWSPDGSEIAYYQRTGDSAVVVVARLDMAVYRGLTSGPGYAATPTWSPDGRRIAFSIGHDDDADLYIIDADGSDRERLTTLGGHSGAPYWSPDSKQIAFHSNFEGEWGIYILTVEGGSGEQPVKISR